MSTVDVPSSASAAPAGPARVVPAPRDPVRAWLRLFAAELRLVFLRRRNMLLLAVTVVFPIVIGIALRVAAMVSDSSCAGTSNCACRKAARRRRWNSTQRPLAETNSDNCLRMPCQASCTASWRSR